MRRMPTILITLHALVDAAPIDVADLEMVSHLDAAAVMQGRLCNCHLSGPCAATNF